MEEAIKYEKILKELVSLKSEVQFIKKHMFDPDTIMSIEEEKRYKQSMKELRDGKTTSLDDLKNELTL